MPDFPRMAASSSPRLPRRRRISSGTVKRAQTQPHPKQCKLSLPAPASTAHPPSNHATLVTHELAFKPLRHHRICPTTPLAFPRPCESQRVGFRNSDRSQSSLLNSGSLPKSNFPTLLEIQRTTATTSLPPHRWIFHGSQCQRRCF